MASYEFGVMDPGPLPGCGMTHMSRKNTGASRSGMI